MDLAELSIRRPIFFTCLVIVMIAMGGIAYKNIGVDLFPNVTVPIVAVTTAYKGAGPKEIESLISKPIEEKISTISGLKRVWSTNYEGLSQVIAEFRLDTSLDQAEQQVRDKVNAAKPLLPDDVEDSVIQRFDPSDQAIITYSFEAPNIGEADLFDLADDVVKPLLEQAEGVGRVEIVGGREREVHVLLDRKKLKDRDLSVTAVSNLVAQAGENVPSGKMNQQSKEMIFRALGEFNSLDQIENTVVSFYGNDQPILLKDLGEVKEALEDETGRAYVNGKPSLFLNVYKQRETNTIQVTKNVELQAVRVKNILDSRPEKAQLGMIRNGAFYISANVADVTESIVIGIFLTIVVVLFFLGSVRSTIITGVAIPNSLIGSFILIAACGFTINVVSLLALSLSVGLLVDDAIVVRENIFRYLEKGYKPFQAAIEGTREVRMAVIATTFVILAVFGSVAFLQGFTGQFFREFGLTICFTMIISLFDALTIAPMLSAYFAEAKDVNKEKKAGAFTRMLRRFDRFQLWMEDQYEKILERSLARPLRYLFVSLLIFAGGIVSFVFLPKTFIPPSEAGEFTITMDMPPGTSLDGMQAAAMKVDELLKGHSEIVTRAMSVGGQNGEANKASFYVKLRPFREREKSTTEVKDEVRRELESKMPSVNPVVKDYDPFGGNARPFTLNIAGADREALEAYSDKLVQRMKKDPRLLGVDVNYRPGKPEFQLSLSPEKAAQYGISTKILGDELRSQVEGATPSKYRIRGNEYEIRLRMKEDQRDLRDNFAAVYVPNVNGRLIKLSDVAEKSEVLGPSNIDRLDRMRYIQITGDIAPGAGLGDVMNEVTKWTQGEVKLPEGITATYAGDSENFQEFGEAMVFAILLAILFIYMVLASLYESFITPFTIMLALPLAVCGAFYALLLTGRTVDLFSMIGVILLLAVSSKNSILLVDFANQKLLEGMDRKQAILLAGRTRLRPILMTSMALIAAAIPIAIGLNEASKERVTMGTAILGGLVSSTLLTLIVVPCAYLFIDKLRDKFRLHRDFDEPPQLNLVSK